MSKATVARFAPNSLMKALLMALVALLCALVLCVAAPARAFADFVVYVGYSGGPYYEKMRFSDAEMASLSDGTLYQYSSFDQSMALRKGFARGVRLETLFSAAGVDPGNLKRFYFSTQDGYVVDDGVEGRGAWYYNELCGTARYYYPNLYKAMGLNANEEICINNSLLAQEGAVQVPSILALSSSFGRVIDRSTVNYSDEEKDSLWNDTSHMTSGYRLMFGQTAYNAGDAKSSASSVMAMTCIFGGTPTLSFSGANEDAGDIEAEVGQTVTIQAPTIQASDELISAYGKFDIHWSVSDAAIADFVRDEAGNVLIAEDGSVQVLIKGEGAFTVSATYGDSPSSAYVASATLGGTGTGNGGGSGGGSEEDDPDDPGESGGESGGEQGGDSGDDDPVPIAPVKPDPAPVDPDPAPVDPAPVDPEPADPEPTDPAAESEQAQEPEQEAQTEAESQESQEPQNQSEPAGQEAAEATEAAGGQQVWRINAVEAYQTPLMDQLLFGSPAVVAVVLFFLFVLGFVGRVAACEYMKDPLIEARIEAQSSSKTGPSE